MSAEQTAADELPTRYRRLLTPWLFRAIWIPLLTVEAVAQFVFHRQDIVNVVAAVLLAVIAIRYALIHSADAAGGEQQ
ncbi:hypothetical protein ACIBCU_38165 [Streptomyces sp. NPDC051064]|uniref:hypothetical protein n=1 Tax=Streptomyces sp. NPDC051064 TaxID=3365641 RepID=UPI00379FC877